MKIYNKKNNIIIEGVEDFNLSQTLECGQCFRFYKQAQNDYVVVAYKKLLHIEQKDCTLIFHNCDVNTVKNIWIPYFDLSTDYGYIKDFLLKKDNKLQKAIHEKQGVRILNQEFHEMLISFIISQNKQIPHIKQIINRLSEEYGELLGEVNGKKYYSFPDVEILKNITEEKFRELKTGFRAPYLVDAVHKLNTGQLYSEMFRDLDEETARKKLMSVKGVGEKVANCVMLFALGYRNAFPVDVWIKRIMETLYFNGKDTSKEKISQLAEKLYAPYGGYAQQYLFFYGRDNSIGK